MSGKNFFERGRKKYFEGDKSDFIKSLFDDEDDIKPTWDDGENTVTSDNVNMDDCHQPREITPTKVYTKEEELQILKRAKKDSTKQLQDKINSDFYDSKHKAIFKGVIIVRELKELKKSK